jgi:ubiquinone/menaquinone biosynthesis C-methylase UbiE/dienelactone hydrolase
VRKAFFAVFGIAVAAVVGSLWWRRESRRRQLPCPSWLAWVLDNPIMDLVAGTQATLDRIGVRPGERVLDVGSGPGRLSIPAARRVGPTGKVVAVDVQPGMLARLQGNATQAGLTNLEAHQMDITTANSLESNSFDRAWLVTVQGEIPDKETALRTIYHALKPGGTLSITEIFPDPHYQRHETVLSLAQAAGFDPVQHWGSFLMYTQNFLKPKEITGKNKAFDYDRSSPLQAELSLIESRDGVSIHDVSYAGLGGKRIQAYWVVPAGGAPSPAVIFVHPGPGDRSTFLDEAVLTGSQGIASLLVEAPWAQPEAFGRRMGPPENNREFFTTILQDLRRSVDFIISRPEVDPSRIGYVGHSFGALFGGVLAGVEKRIRALVLMAGAPSFTDVAVLNMPSLQGQELEHYEAVMDPIDPVNFVGMAVPAALFFQFGRQDEGFSEDRFKVFAEAGSEPKLTRWYDTGHYFEGAEDARRERLEWLKTQLR